MERRSDSSRHEPSTGCVADQKDPRSRGEERDAATRIACDDECRADAQHNRDDDRLVVCVLERAIPSTGGFEHLKANAER